MMNRRESLAAMAGGVMAAAIAHPSVFTLGKPGRVTSMLLSQQGCGRASAYAEANKIVTFENKTHVVWLDSVAGGFRVRIRTLDRRSMQWSRTYTVGTAHDNHGGPAMTVDSRGFLHVVYFPHHHSFRHRQSKRRNDGSEWKSAVKFGDKLTYPTLMCGHDDTLYLTARRSDSGKPWSVQQWAKPMGRDWQGPNTILRASATGYSHFQEALAWSPDHRTLHLSCRIHEDRGVRETVAYMRSEDFGKTWRRGDGSAIKLPATASSMDVLASGGRTKGKLSHKCGNIAVAPNGTVHVLYSAANADGSDMFVASAEGKGWHRRPLAELVSKRWPGWSIGPSAGMVFDKHGTMYVTATSGLAERKEIVWLESRDAGKSFSLQRPSDKLPHQRKFWPNLERPTGHNVIVARPGVLFAAGIPGQRNDDILSNQVYWIG